MSVSEADSLTLTPGAGACSLTVNPSSGVCPFFFTAGNSTRDALGVATFQLGFVPLMRLDYSLPVQYNDSFGNLLDYQWSTIHSLPISKLITGAITDNFHQFPFPSEISLDSTRSMPIYHIASRLLKKKMVVLQLHKYFPRVLLLLLKNVL
jgi:hypothetical protein